MSAAPRSNVVPIRKEPDRGYVRSIYAPSIYGATFKRESDQDAEWEGRLSPPLEGWGPILLRWTVRLAAAAAAIAAICYMIGGVP